MFESETPFSQLRPRRTPEIKHGITQERFVNYLNDEDMRSSIVAQKPLSTSGGGFTYVCSYKLYQLFHYFDTVPGAVEEAITSKCT